MNINIKTKGKPLVFYNLNKEYFLIVQFHAETMKIDRAASGTASGGSLYLTCYCPAE